MQENRETQALLMHMLQRLEGERRIACEEQLQLEQQLAAACLPCLRPVLACLHFWLAQARCLGRAAVGWACSKAAKCGGLHEYRAYKEGGS